MKIRNEPLIPGQEYHIYNRANGSEKIFLCNENYRYFLSKYIQHISPVAHTFAYCLLPNHFHFLVKIKGRKELQNHPKFKTRKAVQGQNNPDPIDKDIHLFLSRQFANFFACYAQAFNKMYDRKGSLLIKNFKRNQITSDDQFRTTLLYIHLNAVKHDLIKDWREWKYSSWKEYFSDERSSVIINQKRVLTFFGGFDIMFAEHIFRQEYFIELATNKKAIRETTGNVL